jgi:hypothetical protein
MPWLFQQNDPAVACVEVAAGVGMGLALIEVFGNDAVVAVGVN